MSDPIRVLIADDHPVVRDGIRAMLCTQADFEIVGEVATGTRATQRAKELRPDVIMMDLQMPQGDGATAIAQIRADDPNAKIIVLTTYDNDHDIARAIDAGATSYLLKDTPREQLFTAIRAAAHGDSVLSPAVTTRVLARFRQPAPEVLSGREIEVLTAVATGMTNKAIAEDLHISEATVKTHLIHIFAKLGVTDRTAAVSHAAASGLIRLDAR